MDMKTYVEGRLSAKIDLLALSLEQLDTALSGDEKDWKKVVRTQVILEYLKQDINRMKEILGD